MIAEETRVTRAKRTAARVIEGKAIVIVIDERKLHTLNPVGTRVWELTDGRTVAAIVDTITSEFAVEREVALKDVSAFLENLMSLGAIETRTTP